MNFQSRLQTTVNPATLHIQTQLHWNLVKELNDKLEIKELRKFDKKNTLLQRDADVTHMFGEEACPSPFQT